MAAKPVTGKTRSYSQFCQYVADQNENSKVEAKAWLDEMFEYIQTSLLAGDNVQTPLGKFRRADRKARDGRNPQTGEAIKIKAKRAIKFKPNKALEDAMG